MAVHRDEFMHIMSAFPTGVAIVTTLEPDGTPRGLTTNAVTSVSADPPILLVCVDRASRTLPALLHSKRFAVNFMRDDCAEICGLFASKADDKFAHVAYRASPGGLPLLEHDARGIEALGQAVGFTSPASYRRHFRAIVGVSPAAYRERFRA